ncbi:MAG TPA: hypothetical protein DHV20_01980 [Brochothrix thermosphacta]|nr:hypothetical protein [Brochothrix thermosphacta]
MNKTLFLKQGIAVSMLGLGLFVNHSMVKAEGIESQADFNLSAGIRLTAVPSFEFGKIIYDGQETSITLKDGNSGYLSWFDGTGVPEDGVKVYATIKDVLQPKMAEASMSFKTEYGSVEPSGDWYQDSEKWTTYKGNYVLKFNGEKTLVVSSLSSSTSSYRQHKQKGVENFKMGKIVEKTIVLPAGLTPESMEMTIDWNIESAP